MPFCPNPECPHLLVTKRPAEVLGDATRCPDCGTELTPLKAFATEQGALSRRRCPKPLLTRLLVTGAVVIAAWASLLVPSPFLDLSKSMELGVAFGPFTLGLTPFLYAFALVEVVVAIFRNGVRHDNRRARRRMNIAACVLGVGVCLAQGWGITVFLEGFAYSSPLGPVVVETALGFRLPFMLSLAAGSAMWLVGASVISRRGVGNGFAVLVLAGLVTGVPETLMSIADAIGQAIIAPLYLILSLGAVVALVGGVVWFFVKRGAGLERSVPVCAPTCGAVPLELGLSCITIPTTLRNLGIPGMNSVLSVLVPGTFALLAVDLAIIALSVPIVSSLFYRRRRQHLEADVEKPVWRRAQLESAAFLGGGLVAMALLEHLVGPHAVMWLPSLLGVLYVTALTLDLAKEIMARWRAPAGADLVLIEETQDLAEALEARSDYLEAGRETVVQGLYFRSLTYFFGPYVPLRLLGVPARDD